MQPDIGCFHDIPFHKLLASLALNLSYFFPQSNPNAILAPILEDARHTVYEDEERERLKLLLVCVACKDNQMNET